MTEVPQSVPKRRRIRFRIALVVLLLIVIAGAALWGAWVPLRKSREAWRAGRNAEAISIADRWSWLPVWKTQYAQLLAAEQLSVGDRAAAAAQLSKLRGRSYWLAVVHKDEVARRLFARGRYEDFLSFDVASAEQHEPPSIQLDRAAALTAMNRIAEADAALKNVKRDSVDPKTLAAVEQALAARRSGSYPLLFDRTGHALAFYQIANPGLAAIDTQFAPLIDKRAGSFTVGAQLDRLGVNDSIDTTLDPEIQRAALAALGGFRGSIVAIDPKTNEILAIASNTVNGPVENIAIEHQYEPGSVVKVLTGLNALGSGIDIKSMFPYECKGVLSIDGRNFDDWVLSGHGQLPSIDEALAVSCNVVFADIGIRLGADRLRQFMASAGFDSQTNTGVIQVPLGKIIPPVVNKFETAKMAIGLEHESITALHLAMIGSMMANRGVMTNPRLLRGRRSILGEMVVPPSPQSSTRLASAEAAEKMIEAMKSVVTYREGTGKRAAIDGLSIAMKTGTAGPRSSGYNALIVAFAPADDPKIAFGMIAEDAGPAEFAGAKIARDFLVGVQPRLR